MSSDSGKEIQTILDELTQVKGSVTQFVAQLNTIISRAPTREDWNKLNEIAYEGEKSNESPMTLNRINQAIEWPTSAIAIRLKELFEDGKLPLMTALTRVCVKTGADPKACNFILDYNPKVDPKNEMTSSSHQKNSKRIKNNSESYPPILPTLRSKSLAIRAATDKSYRRIEDLLASTTNDFQKSHNGRLASKGRAILNLCLVEILEPYAGLSDEDIDLITHRLLSNRILAKFAFGYNLVDGSKYNLSVDADFEEKIEVIGNLFLAHIGSLREENYDLEDLKRFVRLLYDTVITEYIEKNDPLAKASLMELDLLFKSITNLKYAPHHNFQYEIRETNDDPHVVKILVDGVELGSGVSSASLEAAKYRAANDVFDGSGNGIRKIWEVLVANVQEHNAQANNGATPVPLLTNGPMGYVTGVPAPLGYLPNANAVVPPPLISAPVPIPQAQLAIKNSTVSNEIGAITNSPHNQQQPPTQSQPPPQQQINPQLQSPQAQEQQPQPRASAGSNSPKNPYQQVTSQHPSAHPTPVIGQQQMTVSQQPQQYVQYQQQPYQIYPHATPQAPYGQQSMVQAPPQHIYQQQNTTMAHTPVQAVVPIGQQGMRHGKLEGAYYDLNNILTLPLEIPGNNSALSTLNTMISQAKIMPPEYNVHELTPLSQDRKLFYATVQIGDVYLGAGYGSTKKEARHKAAMCALNNPEKCLQVGLTLPLTL